MATSVTTSLPLWLSGCTYDANSGNDLRNSHVAATFFDEGIIAGNTISVRGGVVGGTGLLVSAGTGMQVLVQPGSFVVPNSASPTAGGYLATLASQATLTVQTADPTNPRVDIIVAYVSDAGSSSSFGAVSIITGSAAPTPSAPAAPANSITLAQLSVPANTTSITSSLITDKRPFTTTAGGVLVAPVGSVTGPPGQIGYDSASQRYYDNSGTSSATQIRVLPWAPVTVTSEANITVNSGTTEATVLSTTVTTDGFTNMRCYFKWPSLLCTAGSNINYSIIFRLYIDSVLVDSVFTPEANGDGYSQAGGSFTYYTNSTDGTTPASGSHTVKVTAVLHMTTNISTVVNGGTGARILLRVEPVAL